MSIAALNLPRNIPDLIEKVRDIIKRLVANATVYTSPNPSAATLGTLTDNLEQSYQAALKRGTDKKIQMRLDEKALREKMSSLRGYIQTTSGGNAEKINLVADIKRKGSPKGIFPAPSNVRCDYGLMDGEIIFRWKGVPGRTIYLLQMNDSPGDESKWKDSGYTGKTNYTAKELISGKEYAFRIATITRGGISGWSNSTSHKAR